MPRESAATTDDDDDDGNAGDECRPAETMVSSRGHRPTETIGP